MEAFNISLTVANFKKQIKIDKDVENLNNAINKPDLNNIKNIVPQIS